MCFFFFNDTAPTEIYTLSLHDALPIFHHHEDGLHQPASASAFALATGTGRRRKLGTWPPKASTADRSEEHTSELQSRQYLVCRLLLEKKKKKKQRRH